MAEVNGVRTLSLKDILEAWELSEYFPAFQKSKIDLSLLEEIVKPEHRPTLQDIIPIPGDLVKFIASVRNLFGDQVTVQHSSESGGSVVVGQDTNNNSMSFPLGSPFGKESSTVDEEVESWLSSVIVSKESASSSNEVTLQDSTTPKETPDLDESSSAKVSSGNSSNSSKRTSSSLNTIADSDFSPTSTAGKRACVETSESIRSVEVLRTVLKKSGTGRYLLALSQKNESLQNESDKNKLAELIIDHEIVNSQKHKITSSRFEELDKLIHSLFPKECENTYYIPYKKDGKRKCLAKGKLVSQYYSQRKHLKSVGIIRNCHDNESENDDDDGEDVHLLVEGLEEKLNFLKANDEPWERVVEYWKETSKLRVKQLQRDVENKVTKSKGKAKSKTNQGEAANSDLPANVTQYLMLYPALKTRLGYTLLEIDFDIMYPEHKLKVFSELHGFTYKALKALKAIDKKPSALQDNLQLLEEEELTREAQVLLILESLCYLDTVVTVSRKKTKVDNTDKIVTWRPPHVEIQEGLITRVETLGKMESFIDARYDKFASWGIPVQPFCMVVTDDLHETENCYTIVGRRTWYFTTSPVRALDICFKILHATHAKYSPEAHRLWMLIQKKLYYLDTKFDDNRDAQLNKLLQKFE